MKLIAVCSVLAQYLIVESSSVPKLIYSERYASVKYYPERSARFTQEEMNIPSNAASNSTIGRGPDPDMVNKTKARMETVAQKGLPPGPHMELDEMSNMSDVETLTNGNIDDEEESARIQLDTIAITTETLPTTKRLEGMDEESTEEPDAEPYETNKPPTVRSKEHFEEYTKKSYGITTTGMLPRVDEENAPNSTDAKPNKPSSVITKEQIKETSKNEETTEIIQTTERLPGTDEENTTGAQQFEANQPPNVHSKENLKENTKKFEEATTENHIQTMNKELNETSEGYKPPNAHSQVQLKDDKESGDSKNVEVETLKDTNIGTKEDTTEEYPINMDTQRIPERLQVNPAPTEEEAPCAAGSGDEVQDLNDSTTETPFFRIAVEDEGASPKQDTVSQGVFYLFHPHGALQRIMYTNRVDHQNNEYTSLYRYTDVEPITGPIYLYDPATNTLQPYQHNV